MFVCNLFIVGDWSYACFFVYFQHDPPMEIKDIVADLMDGKMLLNLLEVLLNTTLVWTFAL